MHEHTHTHPAAQPIAPPPEEAIGQLADLFHLLGDATRLRIVLACLTQPTAVGDIANTLSLSSSLVSHHLRLLRGARLVRGQRQQRQVLYATADAHIRDMLVDMIEHAGEDAIPHAD